MGIPNVEKILADLETSDCDRDVKDILKNLATTYFMQFKRIAYKQWRVENALILQVKEEVFSAMMAHIVRKMTEEITALAKDKDFDITSCLEVQLSLIERK